LEKTTDTNTIIQAQTKNQITVEEVDWLLEFGHLLFYVLREKEIAWLHDLLSSKNAIGNPGFT